jgi:hypothetical protein
MRGKLFTLAAAVSAVICLAVSLLWLRSAYASDQITWRGPSTILFLQSSKGQFGLYGALLDRGTFHYFETERPGLTYGAFPPADWKTRSWASAIRRVRRGTRAGCTFAARRARPGRGRG